MGSKNVETVRALHAAYNGRHFEEARDYFASAIRYRDQPRGETMTTPEEYLSWLRSGLESFSDSRIVDAQYIGEGDIVVGLYYEEGTQDGPLSDQPASGRTIRLPICTAFEFDKEGLISGARAFYDLLTLYHQLGIQYTEEHNSVSPHHGP